MAANLSAGPARRSAPKAAPERARLRVVRPDDRVRTVGAISTAVAGFFFVVMFALAGLHAVVVQTQAVLDEVNADISALEETRINTLAEQARASSAVGISAAAQAAGYVPAPEVVNLVAVPPGRLAPPIGSDPFAGGAAG
jgi:hypothetical protein